MKDATQRTYSQLESISVQKLENDDGEYDNSLSQPTRAYSHEVFDDVASHRRSKNRGNDVNTTLKCD